jgi:hypothetical protein
MLLARFLRSRFRARLSQPLGRDLPKHRPDKRSALEWVIDQYQVTEHNGIRSDPNREDDPEYIVRLVGQVVRVSLETVRLVASLPPLTDA